MSKFIKLLALSSLLVFGVACGDDDENTPDNDSGVVTDSGIDSGVVTDSGVDAGDPCIGPNGCKLCQVDGNNDTFINQCGDPRVQCQPYTGTIPPPPP